jgi:hypothetical protein
MAAASIDQVGGLQEQAVPCEQTAAVAEVSAALQLMVCKSWHSYVQWLWLLQGVQ